MRTDYLQMKIPRSLTAALQLLQQYTAQGGHYYWISGEVSRKQMDGFLTAVAKQYPILKDAPARAHDKTVGRASVHLTFVPNADKADSLVWVLQSSAGKGGLADSTWKDYETKDTREQHQWLTIGPYQLYHYSRRVKEWGKPKPAADGKKTKPDFAKRDQPGGRGWQEKATWTWRINDQRFREYEKYVYELAKQHNNEALQEFVHLLAQLPLFSRLKAQVYKLHQEAGKLWKKWNCPGTLQFPPLPSLHKQRVYDNPPYTVADWLNKSAPSQQPVPPVNLS